MFWLIKFFPTCRWHHALATCNNLNILIENVNQELVDMINWYEGNWLSITFGKCKYMIFRRRFKLPREMPVIFMNGVHIERISHYRFLGVLIDEKLKFGQNIHFVLSNTSKFIFILDKLRNYLHRKHLLIIYYTLINIS